MPRGGKRMPSPGRAYAQRSDLNSRVVPGQTYGQATQQLNAMRTVPMGPPPELASAGPSSIPRQTGTPPAALPQGQAQITPLTAPTQRPLEPVSAGAALGPGAGNEVLPQSSANPGQGSMADYLNQLAQSSGSSSIKALAARATQAAQQPQANTSARPYQPLPNFKTILPRPIVNPDPTRKLLQPVLMNGPANPMVQADSAGQGSVPPEPATAPPAAQGSAPAQDSTPSQPVGQVS